MSPPAPSSGQSTPLQGAPAAQAELQLLAQMLHDTVSQTLTGTYLQAVMITRQLEASGSDAAGDMANLTAMIHQAVVEMQTVVRQLKPGSEPSAP